MLASLNVILAFTSAPPLGPSGVRPASRSRAAVAAQVPADTRPKFTSGLLGRLLGKPASPTAEPRSAANGNLPEVTNALGLTDPWPGRDLAWKNAELEVRLMPTTLYVHSCGYG